MRTYRSELRTRRAEETRSRVRSAARALFESDGFRTTTIAAIAERAQVSQQTIYATFGSKVAILRELLEQMEEAAESAAWRERIAAAQEPAEILDAFAQWTRSFFSTSRVSMQMAGEAMADPEIGDLVETGNRRRRDALEALIGGLADRGALRPDLPTSDAVDRVWMLTGIEMYLAATGGCGWSDEKYGLWLSESLQRQVLR